MLKSVLEKNTYSDCYKLCEFIKEENVPMEDVYVKTELLKAEGYFTVVECINLSKKLFKIRAFKRE